tara:strand:- start:15295 stop:15921 length:627 start_codon:yes stop_codon:yes gene_type:complete
MLKEKENFLTLFELLNYFTSCFNIKNIKLEENDQIIDFPNNENKFKEIIKNNEKVKKITFLKTKNNESVGYILFKDNEVYYSNLIDTYNAYLSYLLRKKYKRHLAFISSLEKSDFIIFNKDIFINKFIELTKENNQNVEEILVDLITQGRKFGTYVYTNNKFIKEEQKYDLFYNLVTENKFSRITFDHVVNNIKVKGINQESLSYEIF